MGPLNTFADVFVSVFIFCLIYLYFEISMMSMELWGRSFCFGRVIDLINSNGCDLVKEKVVMGMGLL
jgi:hypothetical protein